MSKKETMTYSMTGLFLIVYLFFPPFFRLDESERFTKAFPGRAAMYRGTGRFPVPLWHERC